MTKKRNNMEQIANFLAESNRIEGYEFAPSLYLAALRGRPVDIPHVTNSVAAWKYVTKHNRSELRFADLLHLFQRQMNGLLSMNELGGYRKCQVRVGPHVPPPPEHLPRLMDRFMAMFNEQAADPLTLHYEFEWIHPFVDGNGRTGRLLWAWDLMRRGNSIYPILDHYGTDDFHTQRNNYYTTLQAHHYDRDELVAAAS